MNYIFSEELKLVLMFQKLRLKAVLKISVTVIPFLNSFEVRRTMTN